MPLPLRLARGVAALLGGLLVGVASAVVHADGAVAFALALGAPAATLWALPPGWHSRVPFAVGWAAVVVYAAQQRPEGDYLVSADAVGYSLLGLALVQVLLAILTTRPLRPDPAGDSDAPPERSPAGS